MVGGVVAAHMVITVEGEVDMVAAEATQAIAPQGGGVVVTVEGMAAAAAAVAALGEGMALVTHRRTSVHCCE